MAALKHVGRVKATGKKCIVAYRTLPGDAYNCLIVPTENLPDSYHDAIINLVESNAGQSAYEFAETMARTNFPDGSIMLSALHTQNRMIKVSTDQIEMLPTNSYAILLSELNQVIAEQRGVAVDNLALRSADVEKAEVLEVAKVSEVPPSTEDFSKTTSASINEDEVVITEYTDPVDAAKHYRSQADKLAKQAANFRRLAEELVPAPKKKVKSD